MSGWLRGSGARKLVVIAALVVVTVATRSQPVWAQARPDHAERVLLDSLLREEGLPLGLAAQAWQRARGRKVGAAGSPRGAVTSPGVWRAVVADLAVAYAAAVHRGLAVLDEIERQVQFTAEQRRALSAAVADPFFAAVLRNVETTPDEFRSIVRRVAGPDSVRLTPPFGAHSAPVALRSTFPAARGLGRRVHSLAARL